MFGRYLLAGGVAVAVDRANVDVALVVAERLVLTLSLEDELQTVERSPCVYSLARTHRRHASRQFHHCVQKRVH